MQRRLLLCATALLALGALGVLATAPSTPDGPEWTRAEVEQLISWYAEITLDPDQEAVRRAALDDVPAACCGDFPAATCCCECNLSRATWGLAKHLITREGATAERVREEVLTLWRELNPDGFSGDVCGTGGCGRPFAEDGCGGMNPTRLSWSD